MSTYESGYTGGVIENELVGAQNIENQVEYRRYFEALSEARQHQLETKRPYNPAEPNVRAFPFAAFLHAEIADKLNLNNEEWESGKLLFFTSVDTIFDKKHGVDAFIELRIDSEKSIIVTLDITTNQSKKTHKADIIVAIPHEGLDWDMDKERFDEIIEQVAGDIVGFIQDKQNREVFFFTSQKGDLS